MTTQEEMEYFNTRDASEWSLLGFLEWRSQFSDFSNKTAEHGVFYSLVKKIINEGGNKSEAARKAITNLRVRISLFFCYTVQVG